MRKLSAITLLFAFLLAGCETREKKADKPTPPKTLSPQKVIDEASFQQTTDQFKDLLTKTRPSSNPPTGSPAESQTTETTVEQTELPENVQEEEEEEEEQTEGAPLQGSSLKEQETRLTPRKMQNVINFTPKVQSAGFQQTDIMKARGDLAFILSEYTEKNAAPSDGHCSDVLKKPCSEMDKSTALLIKDKHNHTLLHEPLGAVKNTGLLLNNRQLWLFTEPGLNEAAYTSLRVLNIANPSHPGVMNADILKGSRLFDHQTETHVFILMEEKRLKTGVLSSGSCYRLNPSDRQTDSGSRYTLIKIDPEGFSRTDACFSGKFTRGLMTANTLYLHSLNREGQSLVHHLSLDSFQWQSPLQLSVETDSTRVIWGNVTPSAIGLLTQANQQLWQYTLIEKHNDTLSEQASIPLPIREPIKQAIFEQNHTYLISGQKQQHDTLWILDRSSGYAPAITGRLGQLGKVDFMHNLENGFLVTVGKLSTRENIQRSTGIRVTLIDTEGTEQPVEINHLFVGDKGAVNALAETPQSFITGLLDDHKAFGFPVGSYTRPMGDVEHPDAAGETGTGFYTFLMENGRLKPAFTLFGEEPRKHPRHSLHLQRGHLDTSRLLYLKGSRIYSLSLEE